MITMARRRRHLRPVIRTHPFEPGLLDGRFCAHCELPAANRHHLRDAVPRYRPTPDEIAAQERRRLGEHDDEDLTEEDRA